MRQSVFVRAAWRAPNSTDRKACLSGAEILSRNLEQKDWHEILHFWNERVAHFASLAGAKSWSQSVCTHYWKLARYVARLPSHRCVERVLAWTPPGSRYAGRPANCWEERLVTYCRKLGGCC